MTSWILALDGPAGAGKSTTAKRLALRLKGLAVDTGALYRAVTLAALRKGLSMECDEALTRLARSLDLQQTMTPEGDVRTLLHGEDVSEAIRSPEVDRWVSQVSACPGVRRAMVELQRTLANGPHRVIVLEGRDIGTVVFPDAPLKVYLTALPTERARRRLEDLRARGISATLEEVMEDLRRRDRLDSSREDSPLRVPRDAVVLDTTDLTLEEQVDGILLLMKERGWSG